MSTKVYSSLDDYKRDKVQGSPPFKSIEFCSYINRIKGTVDTYTRMNIPADYDHVMLLSSAFNYDVMLAWDDDINAAAMYLGHWNDGVIN